MKKSLSWLRMKLMENKEQVFYLDYTDKKGF